MIQEGAKVYYIADEQMYSGIVIDKENTTCGFRFSIDSYGGCEGNFKITSDQIGISVFTKKEDALKAIKKG